MGRDMSIPYTDAEIEEFKIVFLEMPTYNPAKDCVKTMNFGALTDLVDFERTAEQIRSCIDYFDKHYNGDLTMSLFVDHIKNLHSTGLYTKQYALQADLNGDGYISASEYVDLMELIYKHDPKLEVKKPFSVFVAEASKRRNGRVRIEECIAWIHEMLVTAVVE